MDALLGDVQRSSRTVCNSVQDLQTQLQSLIASRSSDTRAEHASFTFELRYNTTFYLTEDNADNTAQDGVDPAQPRAPPVSRTVVASETIQNQPTDDPVLQTAVAKHIVNAIDASAKDNTSWSVREVARGAQGWTFTYICKDSLQAWKRANAKNSDRPVIGSYSGNGALDPINLSRPAFDCRGNLTIAFSKASRGIIVKYEHTPLHKTVSDLVDRLAPSLPPAPVNANNGNQRTPKAKRPPPAAEGEDSNRKKRRKKNQAPEAPMESGAADGQNSTSSGINSQDPTHLTSILNVPPAEAERRRVTAIDLLNGKGIDAATLSAEQFNIFANQAPNLQSASLEMLAKYGAERLRIVHPDDREQPVSSNSTPAQSTTATPATGAVTASGTTETPSKKRRSRKKKSDGPAAEISIGDGAVVPVEQTTGEVGTTVSALQPKAKKTRGSCQTCKDRKVKCTKEHPACSNCKEMSLECVYLPPKPRRKSEKSAVEVVERAESDVPGDVPADVPGEPEPYQPTEEAPLPTPVSASHPAPEQSLPDPDNEEFFPDPNILSGPFEHQSSATQPAHTDYFQTNPGGLTFPRTSDPQPVPAPAAHHSVSYAQAQPQRTNSRVSPTQSFPSTAQQPAPIQTAQKTQSTSSRKSLPTTQMKETPIPAPTIPQQTAQWQHSPVTSQASTGSPTVAQQQTRKQSKPRRSVAPETIQQTVDDMSHAAALAQAAAQAPSQSSPVTRSPYQSSARTKSRQAHRSQTNTPVANPSRPPPPVQQPVTNSSYTSTPTSSSMPSYDAYSRYNSATNDQYSATSSDQTSSRIPYEPSSYQQDLATTTTSSSYPSAPSYDYGRSTGAANPLSQALNPSTSGFSSTNSPASHHWPTSQARNTPAQSSTQYSMPAANTSTSQGYGTRSSDVRSSNQDTTYNQQHPSQNYGTYSSQQPTTSQQHSQQNWYGFTSANSNNQASYSSNRNAGYGGSSSSSAQPGSFSGGQRSGNNMPGYSSHGAYGGSDEQNIFDLLRASGSHN